MTTQERLKKFLEQTPKTDKTNYIASSAELLGAVTLEKDVSVWPQVVIRADINYIHIKEGTNIQDGTIIHLADEFPVEIGKFTTVGHGAMIHACTIGNECLIGMRSTILDGAQIGDRCIIGANTLIPPNTVIPSGSMVLGSPGKIKRELTIIEQDKIAYWAHKYMELKDYYKIKYNC